MASPRLLHYADLAKNQPPLYPPRITKDPLDSAKGVKNGLGMSLLCWAVVIAVFCLCVWVRL